ncbi:MAG: hypothetical protein IKO81_01575, partial [Bacteroidales bacterium]|nr:hypothetical protein [Bacteroidales bacterium]
PLTIHYSPFTTHHSPLTIHHSPFTTHHSPFTIHHSPFRPQGSLRSPWAGIRQAYGPFGRCLVFLCEIGGCLGCVDFIFVSLTGWFLGCFVLLSICFPQFWLYFQHTKKQQFSTFYYCFNSYICGKKKRYVTLIVQNHHPCRLAYQKKQPRNSQREQD